MILAQVPRHQAALWNRYDVSRSFCAGIGIVQQSGQFAAIRTAANTNRLPAFTRIDAAFYVKACDRLHLQLNDENLFDKAYFADAYNNNISPGAPRNARIKARMGFEPVLPTRRRTGRPGGSAVGQFSLNPGP